jgi:hypothetical protein
MKTTRPALSFGAMMSNGRLSVQEQDRRSEKASELVLVLVSLGVRGCGSSLLSRLEATMGKSTRARAWRVTNSVTLLVSIQRIVQLHSGTFHGTYNGLAENCLRNSRKVLLIDLFSWVRCGIDASYFPL